MNREEILQELKDKQIVYGEKYTLQAMLLWMDEDGKEYCPMKLIGYSVCSNHYIDVEDRKELIPIPEFDFEVDEIEMAVDKFIELENGQGPD